MVKNVNYKTVMMMKVKMEIKLQKLTNNYIFLNINFGTSRIYFIFSLFLVRSFLDDTFHNLAETLIITFFLDTVFFYRTFITYFTKIFSKRQSMLVSFTQKSFPDNGTDFLFQNHPT